MAEDSNGNGQDEVRCPACNQLLAKKIAPGRYETRVKKSKKTFCTELVVGTIPCSRCGFRKQFPLSSFKEPSEKGVDQCQAKKM